MNAAGSAAGAGRLFTVSAAAYSRDKVSVAAARAAVNYTLTQTYIHVESVTL